MSLRKVVRAVGWSMVVCAIVTAVSGALIEGLQTTSRWSWNNLVQITAAFTAACGVVALVVCVPAFVVLERMQAAPTSRRGAAILGAVLSPLAALILIVLFFGRSSSVGDLVRFWWANLAEFAGGVAPFVVAGAAFGLLWMLPEPARRASSRARRA